MPYNWGYKFIGAASDRFIQRMEGEEALNAYPDFRDRQARAAELISEILGPDPCLFYIRRQGEAHEPQYEIWNLTLATDSTDFPLPAQLQSRQETLQFRVTVPKDGQGYLGLNNIYFVNQEEGQIDAFSAAWLIRLLPHVVQDIGIPLEAFEQIAQLPIYKNHVPTTEQIRLWGHYLGIEKRAAQKRQFCVSFVNHNYSPSTQRVTFTLDVNSATSDGSQPLNPEDFWQRAGWARNGRVKLLRNLTQVGQRQHSFGQELGVIETVEPNKDRIKVELNSNLAETLTEGESTLPDNGFLFYEDVGSLVQIRWQETAIGNLRDGHTQNLYLGNFFFDATKARPLPATTPLAKEDLLLSEANDSQIAAVEAVLAAEDLVLLQGPPGTGKTTVIAEICYQVARRGGRTLIASQANLAVDNALSRLTHHPVLRPLREGDAGSKVGREGAPFLAHRVIDRWLENTAADCENRLSKQQEIFLGLRPILTSQEKFQDYVAIETNFPLEYQTLSDRQTDLEATRDNKQRDRESLRLQHQEANALKVALDSILESNSIFLAELARKLQELREQQAEISTAHSELRAWKKNANDNIYRLLKQSWLQRVVTEDLIYLPIGSRELAQKHQPDCLPWQEAGDRLLGEIRQLIAQGQQWDEICQVANRIYWLIFQCQTTIAEQNPSATDISQYVQQLNARIGSNQPLSIISQLFRFTRQIVQRISQSQSPQDIYRDAALLKAIEQRYKILLQENQPNDSELNLNRMAAEYVTAVTTQLRSFLNQLNAETNQKIQQLELDLVNLDNTQSPFPVLKEIKNYLASRLDELSAHIEQMSQVIAELNHQINECTSRLQNLQEDLNSIREWWRTTWNIIPSYLKPDTRDPEIFTTDFLTTVPNNFEPWQEQLNQAASYLGRYERTMQEWIERLRHPSEEDMAAISQQYLGNVNVVGITCIKAAKWSFSEKFSNFDVVIIDEVSKSTPPELLIPALKGKKVVMIGDYRQLPPILEEENLDELAEELSVPRENVQFLEESWFKQQFDAAADVATGITRKLNVQYRMHPQIMEAINQFYDDGDGGLSCGLADPDRQRAHNLQCSFLREDQHIAWIRMPANENYRENRNGTSYQNLKEVKCIKKICEHFNRVWEARVAKGEPKKEIGIITFYGAQLRLIEEQINRGNQFPNLDIRTGTVDRFQGMEKPVIIVSMVRNNSYGGVGFAKTPERVNVAFSRAKELLVIVGCHQLFTTVPIYQQVSQVVHNYNGFINVSQLH